MNKRLFGLGSLNEPFPNWIIFVQSYWINKVSSMDKEEQFSNSVNQILVGCSILKTGKLQITLTNFTS